MRAIGPRPGPGDGHPANEHEYRAFAVAKALSPVAGQSVLLIGEGEGLLARELSRRGVDGTWLEPCPRGSRPAGSEKSGNESLRAGGVSRLRADPLEPPFDDCSFDSVGSQFLLEQFDDWTEVLSRWIRVLRPGGRIAALGTNPAFKGKPQRPLPRSAAPLGAGEARSVFAAAGFVDVKVRAVLPDVPLPVLYRKGVAYGNGLEGLPVPSSRRRFILVTARRS